MNSRCWPPCGRPRCMRCVGWPYPKCLASRWPCCSCAIRRGRHKASGTMDPAYENKTFRGSEPTWVHACVGENGAPSIIDYASGYAASANALLGSGIATQGTVLTVDTLVYPVCFTMRHAIELLLKSAAGDLIGIGEMRRIVCRHAAVSPRTPQPFKRHLFFASTAGAWSAVRRSRLGPGGWESQISKRVIQLVHILHLLRLWYCST